MSAALNTFEPRMMRISHVKAEIDDVVTFHLSDALPPTQASSLPRFLPGQFNMLYAHGIGEVAISISGDPDDSSVLVHTVRSVGNVTRPMVSLKEGGYIGVRGPFGSAWPVEKAFGRDLVFVAGGLGLAPLRPAIRFALARREQFGQIVILYGARHQKTILYREELERWRGRFDIHVEAIVDRVETSCGYWRGPVGVVTKLIERADFDAENAIAFVCGPEAMMRFSARALETRSVSSKNIYISMERSMKCGVGLCGHCQWGPSFVCKNGPVYSFDQASSLLSIREL